MDIYSNNVELVQTAFVVFGLGFGSIVWAIVFCTGD